MDRENTNNLRRKTGSSLSHRSKMGLLIHKAFLSLRVSFKHAGALLKEWMKKPNALPTYCFEYAPDC